MACLIYLVLLLTVVAGSALCKPVEIYRNIKNVGQEPQTSERGEEHDRSKRFVNQAYGSGSFADPGLYKMRTKRSIGEDCEKLQLCLLHARSRHSLLASFELYFVNKENARLWDHHAHSVADCESRFSDCV